MGHFRFLFLPADAGDLRWWGFLIFKKVKRKSDEYLFDD
jgi:hypothetical protein